MQISYVKECVLYLCGNVTTFEIKLSVVIPEQVKKEAAVLFCKRPDKKNATIYFVLMPPFMQYGRIQE